jgi:hypothetical protein
MNSNAEDVGRVDQFLGRLDALLLAVGVVVVLIGGGDVDTVD